MKSEYLCILIGMILVPALLSRDDNIRLYRSPRALLFAIGATSVVFWIWDVVATLRGHWWFNAAYVLDYRLLGLPIEEWLFFPAVAFVSLFTWESVKYMLRRKE